MWFRDYNEKMEEMPFKQSVTEYLKGDRDFYYFGFRTKGYHYATLIAKRLIKKYLNKSFNKAYSEYCSEVPEQYKYVFLQYFGNFESNPNVYYKYYIDDQYVIKKNKELSPWEKRIKASKVPNKIKRTKDFKRNMANKRKNIKILNREMNEEYIDKYRDILKQDKELRKQTDLKPLKD